MKACLLCLVSVAAAIAQTTTITGTITDPAGDLVSGSCTIQAVDSFTAAAGWRVVGAPTTVTFAAGAFVAHLAPTDTATPAGQYYRVTCAVPRQAASGRTIGPYTFGPKYWLVPTTGGTLDISQVEQQTIPATPYLLQPGQIAATGLADGTYALDVSGGRVTGFTAAGSGSGTVTHTAGALTAGAIVVGNGGSDIKTQTSSPTVDADGNLIVPGSVTTSGPFSIVGEPQSAASATNPASGADKLVFNSDLNDHVTRKDSAGNLHDLEPLRRIAAYVFDGGGSALTGTQDACVDMPAAASITGVTLLADQAGSGTVDVRTVAYGSYTGPSSATSITASATPALSSAAKYSDTTLTGWSKAIAANTVICFHLSSPATSTWIMANIYGSF